MGMGMGRMRTLADAQEAASKAVAAMGVSSLADLRMKPPEDIQRDLRGAGLIVDGKYIPEDLSETFARGKQKDVDLMVGSNKDEGTFFNRQTATADQFTSQSKQRLGELAEPFLKLYPRARTRRRSPHRCGRSATKPTGTCASSGSRRRS